MPRKVDPQKIASLIYAWLAFSTVLAASQIPITATQYPSFTIPYGIFTVTAISISILSLFVLVCIKPFWHAAILIIPLFFMLGLSVFLTGILLD